MYKTNGNSCKIGTEIFEKPCQTDQYIKGYFIIKRIFTAS